MVLTTIKTTLSDPKDQIPQTTPLPSTNESISAEQSQIAQKSYNLRNGPKEKKIHKTKYQLLTFVYFFPKLLKIFKRFDFYLGL